MNINNPLINATINNQLNNDLSVLKYILIPRSLFSNSDFLQQLQQPKQPNVSQHPIFFRDFSSFIIQGCKIAHS